MRAEPPEGRDPARAFEPRNRLAESREEVIGRDRIEHVADVIVAGNAGDAEQGLAVRAAVAGLELALMIEEGGALGEEHREGGQAGVGHGIMTVGPRRLSGNPSQQRRTELSRLSSPSMPRLNLTRRGHHSRPKRFPSWV